MSTRPDICLYHGNCPDGFTAAWAIHTRYPDIEFKAVLHGNPPPDVTGKHVLIVDFAYSRKVTEEMLTTAASITILDHHKTAYAALEPLVAEGMIEAVFDMTKSGARLAWEWAWPSDVVNPFDEQDIGDFDTETDTWVFTGPTGYVPWLVRYIEDRDLWKWEFEEESRPVLAYVQMFDFDFETWDILAKALEDEAEHNTIVQTGCALARKQLSDVKSCIGATQRRMNIGGYDVPVANMPYLFASDAGNIMSKGEPFSASYFDNNKGERIFSLRSDNTDPNAFDVSEIARIYGGGGHFHSSGFKMPTGWEGDPTHTTKEEDDQPVTSVRVFKLPSKEKGTPVEQ